MESKREIIVTEDGTHSILLSNTNESYHSTFGALNESLHIFIESGLKQLLSKPQLNILEIGWGTGLNSLLTMLAAEEHALKIHYTAIEAYPLPEELYKQLNYAEQLGISSENFLQLHQSEWEKEVQLSENFWIKKIRSKAEDCEYGINQFDLVYFDAFAPSFQPEMWTNLLFAKIHAAMKEKALLLTYCCKGDVKRTLKQLNFAIEKLPGPKGKREILRAVKV